MAEVDAGQVTPVETPVAAPEATPAPQTTAVEGAETKPEPPSEKLLPQSEVNKIVARIRAQEGRKAREIARAEARAEFAERQLQERQQPQQPAGKPKPEDYGNDWNRYNEDVIRWTVQENLKAEREKGAQETAKQQQARQMQERAAYVQQNLIAKGEAKYDDWQEVVMGDIPITEAMVEAASRLPNGAEVLYQLAQNPAEVIRIANLSPVEQVWELKALDSQVSAPSRTKTPPPIVPNNANAPVKKDTFELPWDEFIKKRREEVRRRR